MSQYGGDVIHKSKEFSSNLSNSLKLFPLIIFIFLSFPILCSAILQNSSDKSIPIALYPKLCAATRLEPIPLNGSIIIELFFENV